MVKNAGDDCLSFVGDGNTIVRDCEVWNFRGEDNTWGRGITVLGAENIVINGAVLNRIKCYGVYCGQESGYGAAAKAVFNDVKVDVCGQWQDTAQTTDGLLICGGSTTVCEVNNIVISRPLQHGITRYASTANEFINNNTIFNEIPGEQIFNVPPAQTQSYEFPKRFELFESPRDRLRRA